MARSRTLALARKSDAVRLFREGKTFDQIAGSVGYANRGTAHRVVTQAFNDRIATDIDLHRDLELSRLDEMQVHLWDLMLTGDMRAIDQLLRISDQRSRLLGLYGHARGPSRVLIRDAEEGNAGEATNQSAASSADMRKAS